jgi:hypothetical protein
MRQVEARLRPARVVKQTVRRPAVSWREPPEGKLRERELREPVLPGQARQRQARPRQAQTDRWPGERACQPAVQMGRSPVEAPRGEALPEQAQESWPRAEQPRAVQSREARSSAAGR